jgi:hypothetical protein
LAWLLGRKRVGLKRDGLAEGKSVDGASCVAWILGLFLVWRFGPWLAKAVFIALISRNWPTTECVIVLSMMSEVERMGFEGESTRPRYRPDIHYSYTVDGREYIGDDISLVKTFGDFLDPGWICDRFPLESRHRVRYNPAHPAESTLVRVRESAEN